MNTAEYNAELEEIKTKFYKRMNALRKDRRMNALTDEDPLSMTFNNLFENLVNISVSAEKYDGILYATNLYINSILDALENNPTNSHIISTRSKQYFKDVRDQLDELLPRNPERPDLISPKLINFQNEIDKFATSAITPAAQPLYRTDIKNPEGGIAELREDDSQKYIMYPYGEPEAHTYMFQFKAKSAGKNVVGEEIKTMLLHETSDGNYEIIEKSQPKKEDKNRSPELKEIQNNLDKTMSKIDVYKSTHPQKTLLGRFVEWFKDTFTTLPTSKRIQSEIDNLLQKKQSLLKSESINRVISFDETATKLSNLKNKGSYRLTAKDAAILSKDPIPKLSGKLSEIIAVVTADDPVQVLQSQKLNYLSDKLSSLEDQSLRNSQSGLYCFRTRIAKKSKRKSR